MTVVTMRRHDVPDGCPLTARQFEMLQCLCEGLTYQQIARRKSLSSSGVRDHLHKAFRRLNCGNATQAVSKAFRAGWFGWTPPEPEDDFKLTAFQRAYLAEFDKHLQARGAIGTSSAGMKIALAGMRKEQGVPLIRDEFRDDDGRKTRWAA